MMIQWTTENIKEIIAYCKEHNVESFSWDESGFEFKFKDKITFAEHAGIESTPQTKLTPEEIEKNKQEEYNRLMFMSSQ